METDGKRSNYIIWIQVNKFLSNVASVLRDFRVNKLLDPTKSPIKLWLTALDQSWQTWFWAETVTWSQYFQSDDIFELWFHHSDCFHVWYGRWGKHVASLYKQTEVPADTQEVRQSERITLQIRLVWRYEVIITQCFCKGHLQTKSTCSVTAWERREIWQLSCPGRTKESLVKCQDVPERMPQLKMCGSEVRWGRLSVCGWILTSRRLSLAPDPWANWGQTWKDEPNLHLVPGVLLYYSLREIVMEHNPAFSPFLLQTICCAI